MNKLLSKELEGRDITGLDKVNVKVGIYDIFQKNHDLDEAYSELLDYLEDENLSHLIPKVKKYYFRIQ